MSEKISVSFLWLIFYLICAEITRLNAAAHFKTCLDYLDPFECKIKKRHCIIKTNDSLESDCRDKQWKIKPGVTFTYNITFKNDVEEVCQGCCCHPVSADLKSYQNSCPNCIKLWSKPQNDKMIIEFTGNKSIMEEALENREFLKIHLKDEFPSSVVLCPTRKKTRCKLATTNSNDMWTIIASNKNWIDYFEESIVSGYITVKQPNDQMNIHLAIKRSVLNTTQIHFLEVLVERKSDKSKCLPCDEPGKQFSISHALNSTTTTAPPTSSSKTMDDSSTEPIRASSFGRDKTNMITSSLSLFNHPHTTSSSQSANFESQNKTAIPNDMYVQKNLKEELNATRNESKRIHIVAKFVGKYNQLNEKNLAVAVEELNKVKKHQIDENITKDFTEVVNQVASTSNVKSWENLPQKIAQPSSIMSATDSYFEGATQHMKEETKEIRKDNLVLHYGRVSKRRAYTLNSYKVSLGAIVNIPTQSIQTRASESVRYSFVLYRSLPIVMKTVANSWQKDETQSERLFSPIISISVYPQLRYPLKENINFTLNHMKKSNSRLVCTYWNFSYKSKTTGYFGRWETKGCHVVSQNQTCTTCSCNHLTNFALLMSPHRKVVNNSLSRILSFGSGSISILMTFLTIVFYASLWVNITQNPVNRSRAIILMNMCIALIIANVMFLAGSRRHENKILCTLITVGLHYLYLVVFFCMLMEGLDMLITVIFVFNKKIQVKWFVLGSWGFPLLIVGISVSIQFDNYSGLDHCWLSVDNGLRWAFIGPALFIILVNYIILIIVISRLLRTQEMLQKTVKERLRCGVRGIALLTPILGFTWITGIFLIHKSPVMQYIFIISHSLQGIFIFLLHCVFSRQIKEGFLQWLKKKSYLHEFFNSTIKCVGLDQTNMTRTMSTAQSLDDLDSDPQKLSGFQPRKSRDFLIPGK